MIWRRSFAGDAILNAVAVFTLFFVLISLVFLARLLARNPGLPTGALLSLLMLEMFKALPQLLSFSVFAGLVIEFGRQARTREHEAWAIAGLRLRDWSLAAMGIGAPTAAVIAFLAVFAVPWTLRISASYQQRLADELRLDEPAPGIFGGIPGLQLVYSMESAQLDRSQLRNLFVARDLDRGQMQIVLANSVRADVPSEPLRNMEMTDGAIYAIDLSAGTVDEFGFGEATYRIGSEPSEEPIHRLRALAASDLAGGSHRARVELLWRWAVPASALLLALLALPAGRASPHSGREYKLLLAFLGFWLYWAVEGLCKDLGMRGQLSPLAAAGLPPAGLAAVLAAATAYAARMRR